MTALEICGAAAAYLVVVQGRSRRDHHRTGRQGESGPMELDDSSVNAVAVVELVLSKSKFALKVGRLEVRRPVDEEPVQDERLVLQVFVRAIGALRHRVLISHEELGLLLVRPSVGVASTAGGRLCLQAKRSSASKSIVTPRRPQNPGSQDALGKAIRQLRTKKGASLEALAGEAGISKNMLSLIERGEGNPSWSTVEGIAKALGVSVAKLARLAESSD